MKIPVSATGCLLLLAVWSGNALAQNVFGAYVGQVNTTGTPLETRVIIGSRLTGSSGSENNPFNLEVVPAFSLRQPGEIQIKSASQQGFPSSSVLQYWWICDFFDQDNCDICYPNVNLPPQTSEFRRNEIRGCLVETHTNVASVPNLLAVSSSGFVSQQTIEQGASFTGMLDGFSLSINFRGTTFFGEFFSNIRARKE